MLRNKFWIGKSKEDTFGHKKRSSAYFLSSLSATRKEAEAIAFFLAGFASYEVVQVEIREVKKQIKP
jgi:hypothetical protein